VSDREAFFEVCKNAKQAESYFVSLYTELPFYGGPEEGGWWGSDTELVAYQETTTEAYAKALLEQVKTLAEKLSKEARDDFGRQCQAECEWLEARGLDADYLPEVDGEQRYWVTVESRPGSHAHEGDRYYS
jgi:hypothetical protein